MHFVKWRGEEIAEAQLLLSGKGGSHLIEIDGCGVSSARTRPAEAIASRLRADRKRLTRSQSSTVRTAGGPQGSLLHFADGTFAGSRPTPHSDSSRA